MPVYRGNVTPQTVFGRTAAFVGWLREVLLPASCSNRPCAATRLARCASATTPAPPTSRSPAAPRGRRAEHDDEPAQRMDGEELRRAVDTRRLRGRDRARAADRGSPAERAARPAGLRARRSARSGAGARAGAREPLPNEDLYDALTGLPNRALTLDRAERMVARAGRQSGMLAGALFVDIDWFKDVNDKLGAGRRRPAAEDRRRTARGRGPQPATPSVASAATSSWCWSSRPPAECGSTRSHGA